ncbi:MAG TPA: signal peptidase I [Bacteroidales bacterium]|nr:signal peptidase I [Bacteroidales bacterium]
MSKDRLSYTILKDLGFRLLAEGKTIRVKAEGASMYPSIKSGSIILIEPLKQGYDPVAGEIIAWKRDSGIVVHRLVSSYITKHQKYYVTRGDSSIAEDEPVILEQIAGKVVRVENPEGKPVSPEKYINKKPNYSLNRFLVRIISQFYRVRRIF